MAIAITIARGGSKRLPGKNSRDFCGHPLVAWSIVQLRTAHEVDRVYLSTDTDELQEIGERYGAEVIRRPDWPDADKVAANRPYIHAMETLIERGDLVPSDEVVHMLPTQPLVKPGDIDALIREYRRIRPDQAGMFVKLREAIAYRIIHPIKVRSDLFDKGYQYATLGPAVNVCTPAWYCAFAAQLGSDLDSDLDALAKEDVRVREAYVGLWCEPWQSLECDVQEEFDTAAAMMEHKILKGRGMEVYYEYGRQG